MVKISSLKPRNTHHHRGRDKYYQTREWKALRAQVLNRDKGICQACKREGLTHEAGKYATADHIIPRNQGGPDRLDNLELICKRQHDIKSAKERK
jgi:5-methylcytosine-specific restriction protein A